MRRWFESNNSEKIDSDFFNMVFVAEWLRRKFVALVYAGSNPVEHPNMKKRKFYRMAEKRFPNEKDRGMLKLLAEGIRMGGSEEPTKEEMGF